VNSAVAVVQRQLDAYNAQDLDAMLACYAPDCVIANLNGTVTETSREPLRARYTKTFADFPENRARLVNRINVGDTVIDHEDVSRGPGKDHFEVIAIYTVKNGQIARVDFAK
jgi:uncharacterized protein (TIGR02246 family)